MKALALAAMIAAFLASEQRPTVEELEGELVCRTCNMTLDQSTSPEAQRMKAFIRRRIAAGDTKSEIKAKLVAQFGEGVLAAPPKRGLGWLAWLLPLGGLALAVPVVAVLLWRWSRAREPDDVEPVDAELERRLDAELARFGG